MSELQVNTLNAVEMNIQEGPTARIVNAISPTATVSKTGTVTTITITDKNGTTTVEVNDGATGATGATGANGADGTNAYVHIKYSEDEPTQDSDMKDTPDEWIGVYSGDASSAPTAYTSYTWYKIKGPIGDTGPTGPVAAFSVGTVTTGDAGTDAAATITGTDAAPVLNLTIPKGAKGDAGNGDMLAPAFAEATANASGTYVTYDGGLYLLPNGHTANVTWANTIKTSVTVGGETSASKSVLDYIVGEDDLHQSAEKAITSGTALPATTKLINVNIPSGNQYIVNIAGQTGIISGFTIYKFDSEDNRTSIKSNCNVNTPYFFIADVNISAFSIYVSAQGAAQTGTITIEVTVLNTSRNRLSVSDIISGNYANGTGAAEVFKDRARIVKPIVCTRGTKIVCDAYNMNVFEYDILTGNFITSNGAWTKNYTVQNDSAVLITWQTSPSNASNIIAKTIISPSQRIVSDVAIPINSIKTIVNKTAQKYLQSETIISIAHRGNYKRNRGMQCGKSAVISAKRAGYRITENDVALSSDGKFVMWHDTTLAAIGDSTHGVGDYTLEELKAMDFGSAFGVQFAGEKILTFAEWVLLCKQVGVECYIDFKVTGDGFTSAMAEEIVQTVKMYGMQDKVTYLENFAKIRQYQPNARIAVLHVPDAGYISTFTPYLETGRVAFNPKITDLSSTYASNALNNGFELECWFADYDINGFTTEEAVFNEIKRAVGLGIQRITLDTYRIEDVFDAEYGLSQSDL